MYAMLFSDGLYECHIFYNYLKGMQRQSGK